MLRAVEPRRGSRLVRGDAQLRITPRNDNKRSSPKTAFLFGGHAGRDALRKHHSAVFLAKAREEAMLRAVEPRRGSRLVRGDAQ